MAVKENLKGMKIKALAPWFGGKRKLAPRIVELFGQHKTYWEVLMVNGPIEQKQQQTSFFVGVS